VNRKPKTPPSTTNRGETEPLSLTNAAQFLLNECRMVLPGIQSLFGFQLIAVFNSGFHERLTVTQQHLHLVAIGLIAIAVAFIMTPAAYHRQAGSRQISDAFITLCTRLLLWSMIPLALGICIDFYLVARVLLDAPVVPYLACALFAVFVGMWFVLPRVLLARR
jgi:DMSO reductase anchor subunit